MNCNTKPLTGLALLKDKATASELTLIEAVEKEVNKETLQTIMKAFSIHFHNQFHPMRSHEINNLRDVVQAVVNLTKKDLNLE